MPPAQLQPCRWSMNLNKSGSCWLHQGKQLQLQRRVCALLNPGMLRTFETGWPSFLHVERTSETINAPSTSKLRLLVFSYWGVRVGGAPEAASKGCEWKYWSRRHEVLALGNLGKARFSRHNGATHQRFSGVDTPLRLCPGPTRRLSGMTLDGEDV